jgi:ribose 5-phosphate isomerase B
MKVSVAADHRGYSAKEKIKAFLRELGHDVIDHGTNGDKSVDYPDFAAPAATAVAQGRADKAVLLCGSGIGVSMTANKVSGIRAALCHDELGAEMSRRHNDANVLCLPADWLGDELMCRMVRVWLNTPFEGGRHQRRIEKVMALEQRDGKS